MPGLGGNCGGCFCSKTALAALNEEGGFLNDVPCLVDICFCCDEKPCDTIWDSGFGGGRRGRTCVLDSDFTVSWKSALSSIFNCSNCSCVSDTILGSSDFDLVKLGAI